MKADCLLYANDKDESHLCFIFGHRAKKPTVWFDCDRTHRRICKPRTSPLHANPLGKTADGPTIHKEKKTITVLIDFFIYCVTHTGDS